ncbi:MAG TPA: winged helix-turn-helix domain-containing protein [Terriglobia bacterium]|nr:winged helix-turn-helix domain-containing protein [Terriglobia bacterium]
METASKSDRRVRFNTFEFDLLTRELDRNGQRIKLRGHPIDVLAILLERPGELVTREELRKRLWPGNTFVDFEQILNNSIRMLREALGDKADAPRIIETLPRLGYRFIAPVTKGSNQRSTSGKSSGDTAGPQRNETFDSLPTAPAPAATSVPNRLLWIAATVTGLVILISIASVVFLRARRAAAPQQGESLSASAFQIQPVTNAPGSAIFPVFSPDEREVAFLWDGPERKRYDIYVLLLGSDAPLRLTQNKDGNLGAPAWSPDGREIAFGRCGGKNDGVYVVPALGGAERELTHAGCPEAAPGPLAWLSSGQEMLMIDHCPEAGTFDLVIFSLVSGEKRCLTHSSPKNAFDVVFQFSLSPDGRTVAFVAAAAAPCFGDIYTIPLQGGIPHSLTVGGRCFGDLSGASADLMWTPDSKSIVFVSRRSTLPSLWRVSADGGPAERETSYPAIGSFSRDGRRLVYSERTVAEGPTIWRADLASEGGSVLKNRELIRTQFPEMAAQASPDGARIAWRSDRTGYGQIWTSDANGESSLQLTHLGWYSGVPRWSPDGKWISFNQVTGNERQIFMVNSEGRGLRQITDGPYANAESSWSRDGRSIYFTSMRTGSWQVWKHTLEGGVELQLTTHGGYDSFESYDGKTVYFTRFDQPGIWSIPANGGTESVVIADKPQLGYWGFWGITRAGLYLLNTEAPPWPRIEFYSFTTRRTSPVFTLAKKPRPLQSSLSATADGRTIYYTLYDQQSVIKMMEISP